MNLGSPSTGFDRSGLPALPAWRVRARSLLRYAKQLDIVMLFAWVLGTTLPFGGLAPLRYAAAAYFAAALVLFVRQTLPTGLRAWPTLLIPVFCVVSALWAPSASDAIRKGALFALTSVVAIYAASRLSGRNILIIYMLVEAIAAAFSAMSPSIDVNGAWTGIFGQKNPLAVNMFILYICSLALVLDKGASRWFRLLALMLVPVGLGIIVLAKSATTIILVVIGTAALLGHAFLWRPASRIRHMRLLLVMAGAVVILAAALVLFGFMQFDVANSILNALGKDSTLTGRTWLWETAERVMAEHPLTGVGADGFWRSEYGLANSIIRYFDYEEYVKFSFHNSYLENGVAFGYPGYWATVFIAAWALWSAGMNWIRNQTTLNAAFLILGAMVIVRSTSEIDLALEFSATSTLLYMGAARMDRRETEPVR